MCALTAPDRYDEEAAKAPPCSRSVNNICFRHWQDTQDMDDLTHSVECPAYYRPAVARLLRETARKAAIEERDLIRLELRAMSDREAAWANEARSCGHRENELRHAGACARLGNAANEIGANR